MEHLKLINDFLEIHTSKNIAEVGVIIVLILSLYIAKKRIDKSQL